MYTVLRCQFKINLFFLLLLGVLLLPHVTKRGVGFSHAKKIYNISTAACGGTDVCDECNALYASVFPYYMILNNITGDMYVSDKNNHRIRKINVNGIITTIAGKGMPFFSIDGTLARSSSINNPLALALNSLGDLIFCDSGNHKVKIISATDGKLYTIAGTGTSGSQESVNALVTQLNTPTGVAVGANNYIYIADSGNNKIRRVIGNNITTIAGTGISNSGADGSLATSTDIKYPTAVAINSKGEIVFSEPTKIRKIDGLTGKIVTIAGTGTSSSTGDNGSATSATFKNIISFSIASNNDIYVVDIDGYKVRKINAGTKIVTTVVGTGTTSKTMQEGILATETKLSGPTSAVLAQNGDLYVADCIDNFTPGRIGVVNKTSGIITRIAGTTQVGDNAPNNLLSCGTNSKILYKNGTMTFPHFDVKQIGSDGILHYITIPDVSTLGLSSSTINGIGYNDVNELHILFFNTMITKVVNGSYVKIAGHSSLDGFYGDGGNVRNALLSSPSSMAINSIGEIFIADSGNNRIRKVDTNGIISTYAGVGDTTKPLGDNGLATSAMLNNPTGIAINSADEVYIADKGNNRIRKVGSNGVITTVAGTGTGSYNSDNVVATQAPLNRPSSIAFGPNGDLYIADTSNCRIRKVSVTDQKISTIAGFGGTGTYSGDNVAATSSGLNFPMGVAVSQTGEVYIADTNNNRIRKVNTKGIITTIGGTGSPGFSGENSFANTSNIHQPYSVTILPNGDLYVSDFSNNRIRKIDSKGIITTISGNGQFNILIGTGLTPTTFPISRPTCVLFDKNGNMLICESLSHRIRKIVNNTLSSYSGGLGGPDASSARFYADDLVFYNDDIYFADRTNYLIRKIDTKSNTVVNLVGNGVISPNIGGGDANNATIVPTAMALSVSGQIFFVDGINNIVRKVGDDGKITTIAGTGVSGFYGDGGSALLANFNGLKGIQVASNGEVFISDSGNSRIRKIDTDGKISTIAGNSQGLNMLTGNAIYSKISPGFISLTEAGEIYISEWGTSLRKLTPQCAEGYYGIECMDFTCFGLFINDSNVCSGFGDCVDYNTCLCSSERFGQSCEKFACFGVQSANTSVCSGNGECISSNNCTCNNEYYGQVCGEYDCFGISVFNSSVCSHNGFCSAPNNCNCSAGYYGNDCSQFSCFGFESIYEKVCSGNGKCLASNYCSCYEGYAGKDCSISLCFGLSSTNVSVCSSHGFCLSPNNCFCTSEYYGAQCELFGCYQISSLSDAVCSFNGKCVSPNNCSCIEGYYGNECEQFDCFGLSSNNTNVCSNNGKCISSNNCTCNVGYYGVNCPKFDCFGIEMNSSIVCSSNGICKSFNNCSCNDSFYGKDCNQFDCFKRNFLNETVCNKNGKCISPNNCSCTSGYYGTQCELFDCYQISSLSDAVCSFNGKCVSPNNCSCIEGYYGNECEQFDCFGLSSNNTNVCSNNGKCISSNNCTCNVGYYGVNCPKFDCFGIGMNSSIVCSSNGICKSFNNCSCNDSFYGKECDQFNCFSIASTNNSVCHSLGNCTAPNKCSCLEGYYGNECDQYDCFGVNSINSSYVCSGHGSCISPDTCKCNNSYTEYNCQTEKLCYSLPYDHPSVCSSHGKCVSVNNCSCDIGHSGKDCSEFSCFQKNNSDACSSNGKCIAPDTCKCDFGFEGNMCDVVNCFGILSNSSTVCYGNGYCTKPDYCECKKGFVGENCETITCFGKLANDTAVCSGNGNCTNVDTCNCQSSKNLQVNGAQCELVSCVGPNNIFYSSNDNRSCSGKGTCSVETKGCNCTTGYLGEYCENFTCDNIVNSDPTVCSGHGSCSSHNNCTCKQDDTSGYWSGSYCEKCLPNYENELSGCKTRVCNSEFTCNSRGICNSTSFTCKCIGNWDEPYCTSCKPNYFGLTCEKYCEKSNTCSNHGNCDVNGNCSCFNEDLNGHFEGEHCKKCRFGYYGSDCSTRIVGPVKFLNMFNGIKFKLFGPSFYTLNSIDCSKLIGNMDIAKFGIDTICSWTNKQTGDFSILFGQDFTLQVNDTIHFNINVFDSTELGNFIEFMVENADSPIRPIAIMNGKQYLSSCESISIDASASFSGDHKPLIYHWSIISSPAPMADLTNYDNISRLELGSIETGRYVFGLRVQSSISAQYSEQVQFNITKLGYPLPTVTISDVSTGLTSQNLPIVLYKVVILPDCYYSNQSHLIEWTQTSGPAVESQTDSNFNLVIKKFLQFGEHTYSFQVRATSKVYDQSFATSSIAFKTALNPLEMTIYTSDISNSAVDIAIEYTDPDTTSDNEVWTWSCVEISTNGNCGAAISSKLSIHNKNMTSILLPSTDYQSSNQNPLLRVSLTITKGTRSSTSYTDFAFPNQAIIPPTISLIKYYPSNMNAILTNTDIISLDLDVSANGQKLDIDKHITRVWKINQIVLELSDPILWKMSELFNSIVIDPATLSEGSTYVISLTITDSRLPSQPTTFSHQFTIAKSPQPCKCSTSPVTGYALETKFTFSCVNCQNEQASLQLSYGFQYPDSTLDLFVYTGSNSYSTKLPLIKSAFVKITDTLTGAFTKVPLSVDIQTSAKSLVEAKKKSITWTNYQKTLAYGDPNNLVFNSNTISACFAAVTASLSRKRMSKTCQNGKLDISSGKCVCFEGFAKSDCSERLEIWEELVNLRIEATKNTIDLWNQRNPDEMITNQILVFQMIVVDSLIDTYDELNNYVVVNSLKSVEKLFKMALSNKNLKVSNSFELLFTKIVNHLVEYLNYQGIFEIEEFNNDSLSSLFMDASSILLRRSFVGERDLLLSSKFSIVVTNKLYRNKYSSLEISDHNNSSVSLPSSAAYYMSEKSNRKPISFILVFKDIVFESMSKTLTNQSVSSSSISETLTENNYRSISKLIGFMDYSIFDNLDSPLFYKFKLDNYYSINATIDRVVNTSTSITGNTKTISSTFETFEYYCAALNSSNATKDDSCKLVISKDIGICECSEKRSYMIVEQKITRIETLYLELETIPSTKPSLQDSKNPSPYSTNIAAIIVPIIVGILVILSIACLIAVLIFCIRKRRQKESNRQIEMSNV